MNWLRNVAVAAALAFASPGAVSQASAAYYKQVTCYETVVGYETRTVAYKKHVTLYDECGHAYTACVTRYRTVKVPVEKVIASTKWVLVCD